MFSVKRKSTKYVVRAIFLFWCNSLVFQNVYIFRFFCVKDKINLVWWPLLHIMQFYIPICCS